MHAPGVRVTLSANMQPERLILELLPRLRRYARFLVRGDTSRADDLVQDCVERALGRLHQWRKDSDLRAWLFTIMHNLHVNQIRRLLSAPDSTPLHDDMTTAETFNGEGLVYLRQLSRMMNELPAEQREVLYLVAVEGLRYREVATLLNIPDGTVMSRLARARDALRERLNDPDVSRLKRVK